MTLRWTRLGYLPASQPAQVAQLDRASASGAEGPAFGSGLAHRVTQVVRLMREMWSQQAVEPRARHRCQHRHHEDRRSGADQGDERAGTRTGERPAEAEDCTTNPIATPRSEGLG